MTDYLTVAEVLAMHTDQIERYGGSHGVRDPGLLEAALYRPQTGYYADLAAQSYDAGRAAPFLIQMLQGHHYSKINFLFSIPSITYSQPPQNSAIRPATLKSETAWAPHPSPCKFSY